MNNVRMEYYTADWCGPCRSVKPFIKELQEDGWNIEVIDSDKNRDRAINNQIAGIPTFIIYKDGVPVNRFTGARPKTAILNELYKATGI